MEWFDASFHERKIFVRILLNLFFMDLITFYILVQYIL